MAKHSKKRRSGGHTKHRTRTVTKHRAKPKRHHRRRLGHHGGGLSLGKVAIAAAGLAYLTGAHGPKAISDTVNKLPGSKTFGTAATAGIALLAVDRFVKRNAWIRAAGVAGLVLAATQFGAQGTDFKWLGDGGGMAGDEFTGDIEGEDVGDDDVEDVDGDDD